VSRYGLRRDSRNRTDGLCSMTLLQTESTSMIINKAGLSAPAFQIIGVDTPVHLAPREDSQGEQSLLYQLTL
jgi:hypothetical protein